MDKVISQDERHTLPIDPQFPLEVTQEMAKVNVEKLMTNIVKLFMNHRNQNVTNHHWNQLSTPFS